MNGHRMEIASLCRQLRLRNMARNMDLVTADDNESFLLELLRLETEQRQAGRRAMLVRKAGFHTLKTFDGYDANELKLPLGLDIEALKSCEFIKQARNLVLYGNVGTGKTHLATAIGNEACLKGFRVRFFRTAALVNALSEARRDNRLSSMLALLEKQDLLICDEWGYVPLERDGSQLLFQMISDCYEKRSVIITTNLEFSKWTSVFYDAQMTAALIDRLVHHGHLILFEGESYRIRHSLIHNQLN